jgi:hypothetical protein
MDRTLRPIFNKYFSDDVYRSHLAALESKLNCKFEFRVAETPVFIPADLRARLETGAREIVRQISEPQRIQNMERDLPPRYNTPRRTPLPGIAIVDFAITRNDRGELVPKLVELQGFPSLFGLTFEHAKVWGEICSRMPGMPPRFTSLFSGLDEHGFVHLMKRAILGRHDPEHVVLADLHPEKQKTSSDFWATTRMLGIEMVCPSTFERVGNKLYRKTPAGGKIEIKRIYHRVVFDELEKSGMRLPYRYDEDLDVEWFPHPAWYFLWSKSSLPYLDHPLVPRTIRLSELPAVPGNLDRWVLKPFHSFAGGGVNVDPTEADIIRIPENDRSEWCLQEKVTYDPAIAAADGGSVKVEVRMMFLRPDGDAEFTLATNLCRLSRGKMLGVDFNKHFTWVGGSVGIWPSAS